MADLLSSTQKLAYRSVFYDIHDTFVRDIIIFKIPKRTVISSDLNYNFIYGGEQQSVDVTYTPVSGIFQARISWENPSTLNGFKDIKEEIHGNIVRLKVKKEVFEFLDNAQHVEIDGRSVQFFGSSQPHGLFGIDFYNIYYEESN
jgi:hypothetical protein